MIAGELANSPANGSGFRRTATNWRTVPGSGELAGELRQRPGELRPVAGDVEGSGDDRRRTAPGRRGFRRTRRRTGEPFEATAAGECSSKLLYSAGFRRHWRMQRPATAPGRRGFRRVRRRPWPRMVPAMIAGELRQWLASVSRPATAPWLFRFDVVWRTRHVVCSHVVCSLECEHCGRGLAGSLRAFRRTRFAQIYRNRRGMV